ncbi:hypothetical protein [Streptomyces hydrogenans]
MTDTAVVAGRVDIRVGAYRTVVIGSVGRSWPEIDRRISSRTGAASYG